MLNPLCYMEYAFKGFLSNIAGDVIGAIIGMISAVLIFLWSTKQEKEREKEKEVEQDIRIINYFIFLLESSNKEIISLLKALVKNARKYNSHPFNQHVPALTLIENLIRINKEIDKNRIFQHLYKKENYDKLLLDDFGKCFISIDFIVQQHRQLSELYSKFNTFDYERRKSYSATYENLQSNVAFILEDIKNKNPQYQNDPFWNSLNDISVSYHQKINYGQRPQTIEEVQELFIEPLKEELKTKFRHLGVTMHLLEQCRTATIQYNDIKMKSQDHASSFIKIAKEVKKMNTRISGFINKIDKTLPSKAIKNSG